MPPCEVCGRGSMLNLFAREGYYWEKCKNCGLIRINPQPTDGELEAIYQNGYHAKWGKTEDIFYSMKKKSFASLLNLISENCKKGKLLDVGAATGILMEVAKEKGYDPYGIEAAKDGAAEIVRKFGPEHVVTGYFGEIDFNESNFLGTFNVVTMIDLFEHLRDPNKALCIVNALLEPGGFLLLLMPDTSSWTAKILGNQWNHFILEHLFYFSKGCIAEILRKHKFKVIEQKSRPKYYNITYLHNVLETHPGCMGFVSSLLSLAPARLKTIAVPLYLGEMTVLAQKKEI